MNIFVNSESLLLPIDYNADAIHKVRVFCASRYGIAVTDEQNEMIFKGYHNSMVTGNDYVDIGEPVTESDNILVYDIPFGFRVLASKPYGTSFDSGISSKIIFDTVKQLCGDKLIFILASRKLFIYGEHYVYLRCTIEMMLRYFKYVTLNYDTKNDVETNDACLMTMHMDYKLDYVAFFNQLLVDWSILIKDSDYEPVKRLVQKAILMQVDEIPYELYCQEADEKNYHRQDLRKKEKEKMASSNKEMLNAMAELHKVLAEPTVKEPEVEVVDEEDTSLDEYFDYSTNYDDVIEEQSKEKPSLLKTILFHVFVWGMIAAFAVIAIFYEACRLLTILTAIFCFGMYIFGLTQLNDKS